MKNLLLKYWFYAKLENVIKFWQRRHVIVIVDL
jgi:hypothetical protein